MSWWCSGECIVINSKVICSSHDGNLLSFSNLTMQHKCNVNCHMPRLSQWSTILHYLYPRFFLNVFHTGNGSKWRHNRCLFGPRCYLWKGFLGSAAPCVVAGSLPSQVLQQVARVSRLGRHVQRHVDADGCSLRLVVFKVTKPVPYHRLREVLFVDNLVTLSLKQFVDC